jgi:exonuclease VII large subunit
VDNLTNQILDNPDLRAHTPTPPLEILSSSVENSPPNTIEALERNQTKILRDITLSSEKTQQNPTRIFEHQREKLQELAVTQDSIWRIRPAQDSQLRVYTKRQIKPLSKDGILRPRDANRSIKQRKEKEKAANKRWIDWEVERAYGIPASQRSNESVQRGIASRNAALAREQLFFEDY